MKHVRLPIYDSVDLDRLSYSSGDVVYDATNATVRLMDGATQGGFKLATQNYVQNNAITTSNLAANLSSALAPYALTSSLSNYTTHSELSTALSSLQNYTLPPATTSVLGGVKPDGVTILVDSNGVISGANQYVLPTAGTGSVGTLGGVKVDGTTITINGSGVISGANTYVLPSATTTVKGGVIIPAVATSGITNTSGTIGLATATTTQLGGVKVDGSTITINNGVISGAQLYTLPAATTTALGGVIVPAVANSGLTNTSGTIRLATATTNQLGGVKVDGVTITINGSGVIAANITGAIVFQGGWDASTNTPTLNNTSSAYNTNGFEFVTTKSGTVNFGAGNVTFAVGDNVIYDGTKWVKIPIGSSAGTTNNAITFDVTGGAAAGSTFNGSSILTVSYATVGASPLAGSSSLTTVGTIASGTWNGGVIGASYGGTGVANNFTLTITGANRTLDQNVNVNSTPYFVGTNFSGTAASLTAGNATAAVSATSATTATNIAGGVANQLHYQTGAGATSFVAAPTDNTYLKYTTAGGLQWTSVALANAATNLAGGAANRIHYQTATDTSGFITAPVTSGTYLQWNGTNFVFSAVTGATGGTVTSVGGTGTVNGLTLTGSVTTTGNLTLGGTLSLVSPPAIGSTTPNTGAFTALTCNSSNVSVILSPTGTGSVTINPGTAGTINNMSIGATTAASGRFTGITATSQALTSSGGGTIFLNNTTNSRIDFPAGGVAAPTFTNISTGTKLVLYPSVGGSTVDYAIGIDNSTLWFSTATTSTQFQWYGGTTVAMTLTGTGALTVPTLTATDSRDVVYTGGSTSGTITPNAANGNVQTITLTGSITLNAFASPVSGQTITMIITQPAILGPYTLTSTMKFAGGFKTLSTAANAVDMLTISYIGSTYYASLVTGYA